MECVVDFQAFALLRKLESFVPCGKSFSVRPLNQLTIEMRGLLIDAPTWRRQLNSSLYLLSS